MKLSKSIISLLFISIILSLFSCNTKMTDNSEENKKYQREIEQLGISYDSRSFYEQIKAGNIDNVELFIKAGINVNYNFSVFWNDDGEGKAALMMASKFGHFDIVKLLIENGAKVNKKSIKSGGPFDGDWTALMFASENGHKEIVEYLFAKGAKNVNKREELQGETALIKAAKNGHIDIVKILLMNKADINRKTKPYTWDYSYYIKGATALILASENDQTDMVKFLIENGADIYTKDEEGRTAISIAKEKEHNKIVAILEDALKDKK